MHIGPALASDRRLQRLQEIISKKAFLVRRPPEPPFELASGGQSWFYFDCKPVTQDPEAINLVAELFYEKIKDLHVDAIGGLESGAIPISTAIALLSFQKGNPIPSFWVRHDPKTHGTKNKIEGAIKPNSRVVIIDDVTTKGGSVWDAVLAVRKDLNCEVVAIMTMVDREEGAKAKFEKERVKFIPLLKMSDFEKPSGAKS